MAGDRENAYLAVEAALVLPMVFGMILFIVYMLLFQYDRCLMEQDLGAMALWGCSAEAREGETLEEMTEERMGAMYKDKYVAWHFTELESRLERNRFAVGGKAQLAFSVPGLEFWGRNVWGAQASYEYRRLSPAVFIRLCRGLKKLVQDEF